MEVIGLVLAIVGIAFAFQRPRDWVVRLFRKNPDVEHTLGTRAETHFHNDGMPLESSAPHKQVCRTVLYWQIRNTSDQVLQFAPGVTFRQRESRPVLMLLLPQCQKMGPLFPKHQATVLEIELTRAEIEHLRHWVHESDALGLRTTDGKDHWVPQPQYEKLRETLQRLAIAAGLPKVVPEGKEVSIRYVQAEKPVPTSESEGSG